MLHASDTPLNVPYNLLMVDTFQKILRNAALFQNVISEGDSEMEVSARRSFLTTVSILGLSPQGGLAENIMKYKTIGDKTGNSDGIIISLIAATVSKSTSFA